MVLLLLLDNYFKNNSLNKSIPDPSCSEQRIGQDKQKNIAKVYFKDREWRVKGRTIERVKEKLKTHLMYRTCRVSYRRPNTELLEVSGLLYVAQGALEKFYIWDPSVALGSCNWHLLPTFSVMFITYSLLYHCDLHHKKNREYFWCWILEYRASGGEGYLHAAVRE